MAKIVTRRRREKSVLMNGESQLQSHCIGVRRGRQDRTFFFNNTKQGQKEGPLPIHCCYWHGDWPELKKS